MAEDIGGCPERKEGTDNNFTIKTLSDVSVSRKNLLDVGKSAKDEASTTENAHLASYHAEDLQQISRSLVPSEDKAEEKTCTEQKGDSSPKNDSDIIYSSTALSTNDMKRIPNIEDSVKVISDAASMVNEENIDKTKDRINMNSQCRKEVVSENFEKNKVLENFEVVVDELQQRYNQGKVKTSEEYIAVQQKSTGHQREMIEVEPNGKSEEQGISQSETKTICKSAKDIMINTSSCKEERSLDKSGKNGIATEKEIHGENYVKESKNLVIVSHEKADILGDSYDASPDYIGGKSPTFDKVDRQGTKLKVINGISSGSQCSRGDDFLKSSEKEPQESLLKLSFESNAGHSPIITNKAGDSMKNERKDSDMENTITASDKNNVQSQKELTKEKVNTKVKVNENNFKGKNNGKNENKGCNDKNRPIDDHGMVEEVMEKKMHRKICNNVKEKGSSSEEEISDCPEKLAQKCHENEASNTSLNGGSGSPKSRSSVEDSGTSDSEVEFTKRASNDPNFATVYSFLSLFGHLLNLPECSLDELEQSLDNCNDLNLQQENHGLLEKLHLKLLRRLSRSCKSQFTSLSQVSNDRLIKYLIKFSKCVDLDMAWDLEKFGYHVLGSEERLILLKALCDVHFDENPRFKVHFTDEFIKTDNIGALRLQPEGHDIHGNAIWYQQDKLAGFRVYSVEEDDDIGKSWKLLASTLKELDHLVENLKKKAEVNPKDVALAKRKERKEKKLSLEQKNSHSRRGRGKMTKLRRKKKDVLESESDDEDENPCAHCYSNKRPDMVLLCDKCDAAYHTLCLRPPLLTIPEGDWLCPYCQQLELIESLQTRSKTIAAKKKALERVSKRTVFDDIKVSNIVEADVDSGRFGRRRRSKIDYNFTNYNQMINDAISNESEQSNTMAVTNFYGSRSGRRKPRQLNNLDVDSVGSESSEYEYSDSENERQTKISDRTKESDTTGCRRSRRLKRKYGDEEESESSESEEDHFVRRSTRRRKSSRRTYIDYESDDTPEEVILKKKAKGIDDSDEYVASGSEVDPEDILLPRRSRKIISDEDDEDTPDCDDDDETDIDEDLCEDMERNVVSDDSEDEDLVLSPSDENDDDIDKKNSDFSTDDDGDIEDNRNIKERKHMKEKQGNKRGGKDIRNIMKSMREEIEKKSVKKDEEEFEHDAAGDSGIGKEDRRTVVEKETLVGESEKGIAIKEEGDGTMEEPRIQISEEPHYFKGDVEEKEGESKEIVNRIEVNDNCEQQSTESSNFDMEDSIRENEKTIVDNIASRREDEKESTLSRNDITKSSTLKSRIEHSNQTKEEASNIKTKESDDSIDCKGNIAMTLKDQDYQEMFEKRATFASKANPVAKGTFPFPQNISSSASHFSPEATIALSSFNPVMKYTHPQPSFHPQAASSSRHLQHQSDILRPRPYPADSMRRTYDPYQQQASANYPSPQNPYHVPRPFYENFLEQQPLFPSNMHGFPRIAPPQYPGFSTTEQQSAWRPQRYPAQMQWEYPPYRGMSNQGGTSQQAVQMLRPYLEAHNPTDSIPGTKSLNRSGSYVQDPSRRVKAMTSAPDARRQSVSENYAAFRNMVIGPTDESSQKKLKRS